MNLHSIEKIDLKEMKDAILWYKDELVTAKSQHNKRQFNSLKKELGKLQKEYRTLYMRIYARTYYKRRPEAVIRAVTKYKKTRKGIRSTRRYEDSDKNRERLRRYEDKPQAHLRAKKYHAKQRG